MATIGKESRTFADLARRYMDLIDRRNELTVADLLLQAHPLLASLYSAALTLPKVDGSDEIPKSRMPHEEWKVLYESFKAILGSRTMYRKVFDPYDMKEGEPLEGSLADDLADVYRDLREGLELWDRGSQEDAVWGWRFNFRIHWGEHTINAIRAIYTLAYTYDLEPEDDEQDSE
jgi:hypothetical protein